MEDQIGASSKAIDSSNVGFQLLKKCGWKEGTGLGIAEQGRLEPVHASLKKNKSGIGAEKIWPEKKSKLAPNETSAEQKSGKHSLQHKKKSKATSKRIKKMLQEEEKRKERELQQAFFRDFWPDNV